MIGQVDGYRSASVEQIKVFGIAIEGEFLLPALAVEYRTVVSSVRGVVSNELYLVPLRMTNSIEAPCMYRVRSIML